MAPTINPQRSVDYPKSIQNALDKRGDSQAIEAKFEGAKKKLAELKPKFEAAQAELEQLAAQLPFLTGPLRAAAEETLAGKKKSFKNGIFEDFYKVQGDVGRLDAQRAARQSETFAAERDANHLAKELGGSAPFPQIDGFETLGELSNISPEKYREALGGAPIAWKGSSANDSVAAIKSAAGGWHGAQALADKLRNATPDAQKMILAAVRPELEQIAAKVATGGSPTEMVAYGEAVKSLDPSLREQLVKPLASKIEVSKAELYHSGESGKGGPEGFSTQLRRSLANGSGAELVAPLLAELKAAGKADVAEAVANNTGKAIGDLRKDFDQKKSVALNSQANLAKLVYGFKDSMTPDQLKGAVAEYKARHLGDFQKLDASATAAMSLVKQLDQLPDGFPKLKEMKQDLKKDVPALLETNAGNAELKAALKQQALGVPTWAEKASLPAASIGFGANAGTNASSVVVKAAAGLALSGDLRKSGVADFLKKNQGILGIEASKADAIAEAMKNFKKGDVASRTALDTALNGVETKTATALKGLNVVLALPAVVAGFKDFTDQGLDDEIRALVGAGAAGVATADFLVSALSRADSLAGLKNGIAVGTKVFAALGGVLSAAQAVGDLRKGNYGDATGNTMAAAGGLLMLGGPMGVAAGIGLTAGGILVKAIWGSNPAADAEAADEADAKAFLQAGGMPPKVAEAFSDVTQATRRNGGTFLNQMAAELKMSPGHLVAQLEKRATPEQLKQLVGLMKDMPVDKEWRYATQRQGVEDVPFPMGKGSAASYFAQSIEMAKLWMKREHLVD